MNAQRNHQHPPVQQERNPLSDVPAVAVELGSHKVADGFPGVRDPGIEGGTPGVDFDGRLNQLPVLLGFRHASAGTRHS